MLPPLEVPNPEKLLKEQKPRLNEVIVDFFRGLRRDVLSGDAAGLARVSQRLQYPLIKEYILF